MYLSCHEDYTSGSMKRTVNRTVNSLQVIQQKVQHHKKQGRFVMRTMTLVMLLSIAILFGAIVHVYASQEPSQDRYSQTHSSNNANSNSYSDTLTVVVYSGDTLWSIAAEHAPSQMDKRTYIKKLVATNNLTSNNIQEGQVLELPR